MAGMYLFGTVMALIVAWVLSRTLLRASYVPLVIEMPPYRLPHWPSIVRTVLRRGGDFMKTAGTIILVCSMAMWVLLSFPKDHGLENQFATQLQELEQQKARAATDEAKSEVEGRIAKLEASMAAGNLGGS